MCGINGILKLSPNNLDLKSSICTMNIELNHRGPDDNGFWINKNGNLALGQTRLSILDLSQAGHQPMHSLDERFTIIFNGEIFNFKLLNEKYLKNEIFKSKTDTETILKLYQKYGINMLKLLNGMFALAIWDSNRRELILARDRSGKKPLYFTEMGGNFIFSSELKSLFTNSCVKKEIDKKVLYDFLTFNNVSTPNTMFKDISKFKPGHYMVLNKQSFENYNSFNDLKYNKIDFGSEDKLSDIIFNKISESVNLRMISDVPVGAFLSGGVDSSAIVALMRENTANEIKTFTIGFKNQPNYNELHYAEKISKAYNTNHFVKTVTANDLLDFIPKITEIYDEPQADTTAIPIYFISQLAKEQNIKVVLNGDGPDELFSGYSNYERYINTYPYFNFASAAPKFMKKIVNSFTNNFFANTVLSEMTSRLSKNQDLFWPGALGMKENIKSKIISNDFKNEIAEHSSYNYVRSLKQEYYKFLGKSNFDYINWLCYSGYKQSVIERFLFRSDRLGMANSIEARSPFLNHEIVQMALSIPGKYKVKNGVNKYIFKKSLQRILPDDILYRKKMGFNLPIREWAKETIYNGVKDNILQFNKETNLFDLNELNNQLKKLNENNPQSSNTIWTIYFLINWYKKWM